MAKSAKLASVAPEFNRCVVFNTSAGPITVKVLGPDDTAKATRDQLIGSLALAGVKVAEPKPKKGK